MTRSEDDPTQAEFERVMELKMSEGKAVIWLEPKCCANKTTGQMWCEDDQGPCDECGTPWTKYVRAEEANDQIWGLKQFNVVMEKRANAAEAERNLIMAALAKLFPPEGRK